MTVPEQTAPSKSKLKKWITFTLRWGIAIFGILYVVSNISIHDRILVQDPSDGWPVSVRLAEHANEEDREFRVYWFDGSVRTIRRVELLAKTDLIRLVVRHSGDARRYDQLARAVTEGPQESWPILITEPRNLWERYWNIHTGEIRIIVPSQVVDRSAEGIVYPLIDRGLLPMIQNARPAQLWLAVLVFPIVYFITAFRWHALLAALDIHITRARAFILNMVGAFYNTFMPGSTGGDLLKAWYIAKHTKLRTRGVMSVIVDRILGLLALVLMGGTVSAYQFFTMPPTDPARMWCGRVAFGSLLIVLLTWAGLLVFFNSMLRRLTGLDFVLQKLPMQTQVKKAVEAMEIYRRRPMLILWAIVITLPVHATVVISATFAGKAFGLPLDASYYWVVVPVVVLAGAIPISPQGAGVMEFFAILLMRRQGATVSHAFILTMSIRLVQILWNLIGGLFVLRGGYHAPTQTEQQDFESEGSTATEFEDQPAAVDVRR